MLETGPRQCVHVWSALGEDEGDEDSEEEDDEEEA
jgi:hypothetical protein